MRGLIALFIKRPILSLVLGIPAALGFGYLAFLSLLDVQRFARGPVATSFDEAIALAARDGEAYVSLPEATLDCDRAALDSAQSPPYVLAPIRNVAGAYVAFATIDARECPANPAPLVGVLKTPAARRLARLEGLLPRESLRLDLCTYCGASNARAGVLVGSILSLLGLLLYPLALVAHRRAGA